MIVSEKSLYRKSRTMFVNVNLKEVLFAFKFKLWLDLIFYPKDYIRVKNSISFDLYTK
jgi:hypothetical protein